MYTMLSSKKTDASKITWGDFVIILSLQTQMLHTSPEGFREAKNPVDKIKKNTKEQLYKAKLTWDK